MVSRWERMTMEEWPSSRTSSSMHQLHQNVGEDNLGTVTKIQSLALHQLHQKRKRKVSEKWTPHPTRYWLQTPLASTHILFTPGGRRWVRFGSCNQWSGNEGVQYTQYFSHMQLAHISQIYGVSYSGATWQTTQTTSSSFLYKPRGSLESVTAFIPTFKQLVFDRS